MARPARFSDITRSGFRSCSVSTRTPSYDEAYQTKTQMSGAYIVFRGGAGTPGIRRLTEPNCVRVVKYKVFQSLPPKARLVVAGAPWTIRPSFLPRGSRI